MNKARAVLTSRKFWATVLTLFTITGMLDLSDAAQAELAAIIAAALSAIYTLSVAIEDGLANRLALSQIFTYMQDDDE